MLWGFCGEPFTLAETRLLAEVADSTELQHRLGTWLTDAETDATAARAAALVDLGAFPLPPAARTPIPWPPL